MRQFFHFLLAVIIIVAIVLGIIFAGRVAGLAGIVLGGAVMLGIALRFLHYLQILTLPPAARQLIDAAIIIGFASIGAIWGANQVVTLWNAPSRHVATSPPAATAPATSPAPTATTGLPSIPLNQFCSGEEIKDYWLDPGSSIEISARPDCWSGVINPPPPYGSGRQWGFSTPYNGAGELYYPGSNQRKNMSVGKTTCNAPYAPFRFRGTGGAAIFKLIPYRR